MLTVLSGLAPRWGAKRPRLQALWWVRQKRFPGCRAASQPSAGQACSLHGERRTCCSGERACPALGREAALSPGAAVGQAETVARLWGCFAAQRRASLLTTRGAAHMLAVVSGLAPRWGAKRPRLQVLRCVRRKRLPGCGAAAAQRRASLLTTTAGVARGRWVCDRRKSAPGCRRPPVPTRLPAARRGRCVK